MNDWGNGDHLETTTAGLANSDLLHRRTLHQAAFEATLKEVFLAQQIQLVEPLAKASKETVVYGGLYHGEEVAVKVFVPAVEELEDAVSAFGAFKVECEKTMILSRRSKAILQVIEYGDADVPDDLAQELREFFPVHILPFMITERARFGSLDRVFKGRVHLPGFDRVNLLEALARATDGIKEAHDHQVAHRDIKPQNILIFGPGQGKIADFGIARWRSRRTSKEAVLLTPKYSSPEQAFYALTGERETLVDMRGDIYSWAIMVYEVVTGTHPFAWAIRGIRDPVVSQRTLLKAIAANDRRGFQTTGDITFDSLVYNCTCDLKHRVADIALANKVLRQFIQRLKLQQAQEPDPLAVTQPVSLPIQTNRR
jgi:serine/threonine protein kinase